MAANSPATFQPSAAAISKAVYAAVGERYYKVLPMYCPCVYCLCVSPVLSPGEEPGIRHLPVFAAGWAERCSACHQTPTTRRLPTDIRTHTTCRCLLRRCGCASSWCG